jgi:hypothetical protein
MPAGYSAAPLSIEKGKNLRSGHTRQGGMGPKLWFWALGQKNPSAGHGHGIREIACLKTIFNKAVAKETAERSPFQGKKVKMINSTVHP